MRDREVLGLVIATAAGWGTAASIGLAVILAFFFGYSLTMLPLLKGGMTFATASGLALAADTASITVMEIVDNVIDAHEASCRAACELPNAGCTNMRSRVRIIGRLNVWQRGQFYRHAQ